MSIASYSDLTATVANYLARDDLTARIPEFITLAEAKFSRELRCSQMEKRAYATIDITTTEPEFISLPQDFQSMRRVRISSVEGKPRLEFLPNAALDDYRYSTANVKGQPRYISVFGSEMELAPTPDANYVLEMVYRANIPALSSSNASNWLLVLAPDLYLYGALLEAATYMKEDSRVSLWAAGMTTAMDSINKLSLDAIYGPTPLQVRVSGQTF